MTEEEQGAEEGGEDVRCNAVKRFPDVVRDGVRPWGAISQAVFFSLFSFSSFLTMFVADARRAR